MLLDLAYSKVEVKGVFLHLLLCLKLLLSLAKEAKLSSIAIKEGLSTELTWCL